MSEHHFSAVIRASLSEEAVDRLFDAGCDDATWSGWEGLLPMWGEFDRDAPTREDAMLSARVAIEQAGFGVIEIYEGGPVRPSRPFVEALNEGKDMRSLISTWGVAMDGEI